MSNHTQAESLMCKLRSSLSSAEDAANDLIDQLAELDALRQQLAEATKENIRLKHDAENAQDWSVEYRKQLAEAEELHRMQLAAVTAAALGNTRSTTEERIGRENPYWTAAYHDVCNAVDREIEHREGLAEVEAERARLKNLTFVCDGCGETVGMGPAMNVYHSTCDTSGEKLEALTTALSALEKEMRIEAVVAQNFGTKLWADKLAALLAAHQEQP